MSQTLMLDGFDASLALGRLNEGSWKLEARELINVGR